MPSHTFNVGIYAELCDVAIQTSVQSRCPSFQGPINEVNYKYHNSGSGAPFLKPSYMSTRRNVYSLPIFRHPDILSGLLTMFCLYSAEPSARIAD
jgi:hypothetical protein